MSKKLALSISQMRELKSLGVDTSKASMYYEKLPTGSVCIDISDEYKEMLFWTITHMGIEYIPAFTLDDILEQLPIYIDPNDTKIKFMKHLFYHEYVNKWICSYSASNGCCIQQFSSDNPLEATFGMLKWCKQNDIEF